MSLILGGLLCALAVPSAAAPAEVRGLWVVRTGLVSPEAVDRVVDQAAAGGFNTLLVQVRGRGDAFYRSTLEPRSPLLHSRPADFDPLARLLERASARGLKVHAWVNVLLSAHFGQPLPSGHILDRHPEWVMVPRSIARAAFKLRGRELLRAVAEASPRADVEGYYVSPASPGVAEHLEAVVRELLRSYTVDGLHLDFIRYPSIEFDYSRVALESFCHAQGRKDPLAVISKIPPGWEEHRRAVLTSLAQRLASTARSVRPGLVVSAAVVPAEADALTHKAQAWGSWIADGVLDAVCPMAYTPDLRLFREQIELARGLTPKDRGVWAGVGAHRLTIEEIVDRIRTARQTGASGVVLFSHESFDARELERLRREAFRGPEVPAIGPALLLSTTRGHAIPPVP